MFHFALRVKATGTAWPDMISKLPAHVVLVVFAFIILITVFGLCGYHCRLICVGKTTYESIKRIEGDISDDSCCFRFYSVLCGPAFPSLVDLRKEVTENPFAEDVGIQTEKTQLHNFGFKRVFEKS